MKPITSYFCQFKSNKRQEKKQSNCPADPYLIQDRWSKGSKNGGHLCQGRHGMSRRRK